MARGKRVEIVKITVDGADGTLLEVDAKACTKCGEVKALSEFYRYTSGVTSKCRQCYTVKSNTECAVDRNKVCVICDRIFLDNTKGVTKRVCSVACRSKLKTRQKRMQRDEHGIGEKIDYASRYREYVKASSAGEYAVVGVYGGVNEKVPHLHKKCGETWEVTPHAFRNMESRCPYCVESRGERAIRKHLIANSYNFVPQHTFADCRYRRPLPFDFAVLSISSESLVLIEYDGEQHYRPVDFSGKDEIEAERKFRATQRNDAIKTQYCADNGIPLIRIPYTQFDEIETILTRELTRLGIIPNGSADSAANTPQISNVASRSMTQVNANHSAGATA